MEESYGLTPIAFDHQAGGRVTRLETQEAEGSVLLPSGADPSTVQQTNKQTKGTDPRTGDLKTKGVPARVSGLRSVRAGRAGFSFSGALLPARSWLPRVRSWVSSPCFRSWFLRCVVWRPGGGR